MNAASHWQSDCRLTGEGFTMAAAKKQASKYWSAEVTKNSNALDLEPGVFELDSAKRIAQSLKRSAEQSKRRKGSPLQSSMSMLNFYINRAGSNLSDERRKVLEDAKDELRKLFHKEAA